MGDGIMELEKDETVLIDECFWGSKKKLVLTNRRLLVQKRKGIVRKRWKTENEISLDEIEEAYRMMDLFTSLSSLILSLRNREKMHFVFRLTDSQMPSLIGDVGTLIPMETRAITNKYVTAINRQIQKEVTEKTSG